LVFSALLLFCCATFPADTPRNNAVPVALETTNPSSPQLSLAPASVKPDAPLPKTGNSPDSTGDSLAGTKLGANSVSLQPAISSEVKPAAAEPYETSRQRKTWYGLIVAGHSTAALDAWTTRRAISSGYGTEGDPLQRPFATSNAIYATTQIAPLIMDYLGMRMMHSKHDWVRKSWWIPQAASAGVSLGAAVHNYSIVP